MVKKGRNLSISGQTMVEYLLLLALAAVISYVIIIGPINRSAEFLINSIQSAIFNVVQNGELRFGQQIEVGEEDHPSDQEHGLAIHFN